MAAMSEKAPEIVAEVAEGVAEASRRVPPGSPRFALVGWSVGMLGGAVIGFWLARRGLAKRFEEQALADVEQIRSHYRRKMVASERKPRLDEVIEEVREERMPLAVPPPEAEVVEPPEPPATVQEVQEEVENVFEKHPKSDDQWDYEYEVSKRSKDKPYVIHVDELGETDYVQTHLYYYAGDDVLCDERDEVVREVDDVVGSENLALFGHGSQDQNTVFVRNDKLGVDIEVMRNDNFYVKHVLGFHHDEEDDESLHKKRRRRSPNE